MAIESHSVPAAFNSIDDDDLESRSISELVSILRTAFRSKEFDKVEEVLVAKEVKMRKDIENKNKEYELLQSKYEFLRLDSMTQESTLEEDKVDPKGFEKWKETYEELKERESEILKLKELIVKVDEDREKKKSALERFEKLLEVVKKTQEDDRLTMEKLNHKNSELECEIEVIKKTKEECEKTVEELRSKNSKLECAVEELRSKNSKLECAIEVVKKTEEELKCKNSNLECAKREVEHNYELCRRKYDELARRVSQLENNRTMVKNGEPIAPNRNDSMSGGSRKLAGKRGAENDKITGTGGCIVEILSDDDHAPAENLSRARRNQKRKWDLLLNDWEDYDAEKMILPCETKGKESLKKVGAMFTTPPHSRPDNHVLKRSFSPGTNDSKTVTSSSRAAAVLLREDYYNDCAILSEFDGNIQNRYDSSHLKSKDQGKRCNKKWESEAEMRAAFVENDMLCMEAVCILYRLSSLTGKSRSAYFPSRRRGFNEADMLRGSTLALFLISGDSQGRLKKSVMELAKFDISGLIDCRRIAIEHLKQLFEIYKNNEDQFIFH